MSWRVEVLLWAAVLFSSLGCMQKHIQSAAVKTTSLTDNAYMDLAPGGRLRILVPVLNSGGYQVGTDSEQKEGNTIVLSAANLAGYEVSYY